MPVSRSLADEGVVISPVLSRRDGELTDAAKRLFDRLSPVRHGGADSYDADVRLGDFFAQFSANHIGVRRLGALCDQLGRRGFDTRVDALNAYAERLARAALSVIPAGQYEFGDVMEYRGPVYGEDKRSFFMDIDVFLFPTIYENEAQPLVM